MDTSSIAEVGVGVIGYGFMGKAHTNALKTLPYMVYPPPARPRLVALAGRDRAGVEHAAMRYGYASAYTDWRDLVADPAVSLVDNGGPNHVHAEPCIAAAEVGKHVLCEKPLARTAAEARSMLDAVARTHVTHMVGFNYRFAPAVRYAHELIHSGKLGTIYHFRARYLQDWLADPGTPHSWRLSQATAGSGVLGDLGSHVVDLARFLVGEPHSVSARLKTFTATEGFTNVLVTEPHQPFMRHWWPSGHIIGWEHTFVHEFAHLLEAIVAGTSVAPYGATFEDGYRAAVVCEAIADAARERTEVRVTY